MQPSAAPAKWTTTPGSDRLNGCRFQSNRFHYNWHWWYNFGCGDLGNDGIHEFDYTLWGLGVTTHPSLISGAGGKYFFDDDQQFPDTQQITFEYPGDGKVGSPRMLIYEMRLWSTTYPFNVDQSRRNSMAPRAKCSSASEANSKSVARGMCRSKSSLMAAPRQLCLRTSRTGSIASSLEVSQTPIWKLPFAPLRPFI